MRDLINLWVQPGNGVPFNVVLVISTSLIAMGSSVNYTGITPVAKSGCALLFIRGFAYMPNTYILPGRITSIIHYASWLKPFHRVVVLLHLFKVWLHLLHLSPTI